MGAASRDGEEACFRELIMPNYRFTVFTKPWKMPLPELAAHIKSMGFDGVELAVRPGYPVDEENAARELPHAVKIFADAGLTIDSIAANATEPVIRACGNANVPMVRICPGLQKGETYQDGAARLTRDWGSLVPTLDECGVAIGVQNHSGRFVPVHAFGQAELLKNFDPRHVCAVWDAAHNALEGESVEMALDLICGPHLKMVNLKNGFKERVEDGPMGQAQWKTRWVDGKSGFANWPRVAEELTRRAWGGVLCLSAEYRDTANVDTLIQADLDYARQSFAG